VPRKPSGNPPGRPRLVRRYDGTPDPTAEANKLSLKARRALEAELHFYWLQAKGRADDKSWPVLASASRIARRANISTRAVQIWRRQHWYRVHFWSLVLTRKIDAQQKAYREQLRPKQTITDTADGSFLIQWLWKDWPKEGFVKSAINGRRYHSPESYARHLRAKKCVPYDWMSIDWGNLELHFKALNRT